MSRMRRLTCVLSRRALEVMNEERVRCSGMETGGVLVGCANSDVVWVEEALGPGPNAKHGRYSFEPDSPHDAERIARAYEASGRRLSYLGDWHTHPYGRPYLSSRDLATLSSIADHPPARVSQPVMIVVADSIGAWQYRGRRWGGLRQCIARVNLVLEPTV